MEVSGLRMKVSLLKGLVMFLSYTNLFSQQKNIEIYPLAGTLFNHSPAAKAIITEPSYGLRFTYIQRPKTASRFFEKFNYPAVGVAINAIRYGDNAIFGNSIGGQALLNFYFWEKEKTNFQLTTGLGAGYVSKEFENSYQNKNTAIGSHFNLTASILTSFEYEFTNQFYIKPSVGIIHYSNGRTSLPNLGTNFVFGTLGLSYRISERKYNKDSFVNNQQYVRQFKNEISLCPGLSDRGYYIQNKVLPTYSIHYNCVFYTSKINALKVGMSAEYKNNDYDPDYNLLTFKDNADLALTFGDEIYFGRVSFHATLGAYLYSYYQTRKFVYQRWGLSYRIPLKSDKIGLSVGWQLKVHLGAAELTEAKFSMLF